MIGALLLSLVIGQAELPLPAAEPRGEGGERGEPAAADAGVTAPAPVAAPAQAAVPQGDPPPSRPNPGATLASDAMAVNTAPYPVGPAEPTPGDAPPRLDVHAELISAGLFRNDSDFDRSSPVYDENGQTVGFLGTVFRPGVDFHVWRSLRMHYDAEVGLNFWSMHDPNVQASLAPAFFVMKHRQLYADGELKDGRVGFKVGYSRLVDTTSLFLNGWYGNAQLFWAPNDLSRYTVFAAQLPDDAYEGIDVEQNNFARDIFAFGARATYDFSGFGLDATVEVLADNQRGGQSRTVVAPGVRVDRQLGPLDAFVAASLQVGRLEGERSDGGDALLLAWAVQAHGTMPSGPLQLTFNLLLLSPDDATDGNGRSGAFLYSGRNTSATTLLTEDELLLVDWRDGLDRRMSTLRGGLWQNRAGLTVMDVKAVWNDERLRPGVIVGLGTTLNPANALSSAVVGLEADVFFEASVTDHLTAKVLAGVLFPGGAGPALVNRIDPLVSLPVVTVEASLRVSY